jgi:hypothetical protein
MDSPLSRRSAIKPPGFDKTRWLFERSRIIDSDGEMLGRLRCRGDHAHPIRRLELVPRPCGAIATMHALSAKVSGPSAVTMCYIVAPSTIWTISSPFGWRSQALFAGKFAGEDGAVAVRRQSCEGPLPLGCGRLRGSARATSSAGQFGLEIHDGEYLFLRLAMTLA